MTTLFIFEQPECCSTEFYAIDGDYTHLHDVFINTGNDEDLEEELLMLLYGGYNVGTVQHQPITREEANELLHDYDCEFIVCGEVC